MPRKELTRTVIEWDDTHEPGWCPGTVTFQNGHSLNFDHIAWPKEQRDVRYSQKYQATWRPVKVRRAAFTYQRQDSYWFQNLLTVIIGGAILALAFILVLASV